MFYPRVPHVIVIHADARIFVHGENKVIDFVVFFFFNKLKFIQVSFTVTLCNKYLGVI